MIRSAHSQFILRTVSAYGALATAWIFLSDRILGLVVKPQLITAFGTTKGIAFVIVTSAFLVLALRRAPRIPARPLAEAKAWPWPHTAPPDLAENAGSLSLLPNLAVA